MEDRRSGFRPIRILLLAIALFPASSPSSGLTPGATEAPADASLISLGETVYRQQRCRVCHSIGGRGGRYPLDGIGARLEREKIRLWIVAPNEIAPKVRKRAYDSLPAHELEALIAYMQSLK